MIFVTVGTHEQQFDRLIKYMDEWAADNDEAVIIQAGYSTYEPRNCKWQKLFSYCDMTQNIADARIVITHGGPSSFIAPLQIGKMPIVVPRKQKFDEHVNDHQVQFCKEIENRLGIIKVVEDVEMIGEIINNYDKLSINKNYALKSNNDKFCKRLDVIVSEMFENDNN